jgi:transposase-like protein
MFLIRGLVFTHEAVRDWELAPLIAEGLRKRRAGKVGRCWHIDETYLKIAGEWCYLYRAIDRDGNLVDVYLSETRDMAAAKAFLRSARDPSPRSSPSRSPLTATPATPRPSPTNSARMSITAPVSTKIT